tara:strand:+ start:865 stop:1767 length:903 start_codon:yes stop_codon:yes gene_type:complete
MLIDNLGICLVTGASGFVGERLVTYLNKLDVKVKVLGRENIHNSIFNQCDFLKDEIEQQYFENVDTVFHLAGLAHDQDNKRNFSDYERLNVETTKKIADISIKCNVKNFIFLSSIKAISCDNKDIENLKSEIYGKTKKAAEIYLQGISKSTDMKVNIIRSSLVYGPTMKGNLKSLSDAINAGWFPKLTKDTNRRSMIHVDDLVRALIFAVNESSWHKPLVVSDGKSYSSKDIYDSLSKNFRNKIFPFRLPELLLKLGYLIPVFRKKLNKLYGDDFYSSEEILQLGFSPKFSFKEYNEKGF